MGGTTTTPTTEERLEQERLEQALLADPDVPKENNV